MDFLNALQKLVKDAFGIAAHPITERFIFAKTPRPLKKSINTAQLENGTYEKIVTQLQRELELNGLEAPDELQINTVSHNTANTIGDRILRRCHHCKKPGRYRNQCRLLESQKEQSKDTQNIPENENSGANNSIPNNNTNKKNNNHYKNSHRAERNPKTVYPPCETCGKTNSSTQKCQCSQ